MRQSIVPLVLVSSLAVACGGGKAKLDSGRWAQCPPAGVELQDCVFPDAIVNESSGKAEEALDALCNTPCRSVKRLDLSISNGSISELKPLTRIERIVEDLQITFSPNLKDLQGFESLKEVGQVFFDHNDSLQSLHGLENVKPFGNIEFDNCPALTDLSILTNYTHLNRFYLVGLQSLTDLSPLRNVVEADEISIQGCPSLKSIDSLNELVKVNRNLDISSNFNLERLKAFAKLESVSGVFRISQNPHLPQCEADAMVARVNASHKDTYGNDHSATCN